MTSPRQSNIFRPFSSESAVTLPASKSIGARYLMASYFAGTLPECRRFDDCDDLRVIQKALLQLLTEGSATPEKPATIDIHASGTAFRFVTAAVASTPGADFIVTGTPRLCGRPMAPLLDVLRKAGAKIEALGENGTGPYRVAGKTLEGGEFEIKGDVSSQFISALMLVAPTWKNGMTLRFSTPLVSRPYAEMTARVMQRFGASVSLTEEGVSVEPGAYAPLADFKVEADWSAAGFFYEAAAFMPIQTDIADLVAPSESMQGDTATARFFEALGVTTEFCPRGGSLIRCNTLRGHVEADLTDNPDLAPAFAVACALNSSRFKFTGVRNLRLKECDRLAAIKTEFEKLGYTIDVDDDSIEWQGGKIPAAADPEIDTYDDHRIAMAFAMAALRLGEIKIKCPDVVNKSFEDFWGQLPKVGLHCERRGEIMTVKSDGTDIRRDI